MRFDDKDRDWFRKRRFPFFRSWGFDDIDRIFEEMEKMIEHEFEVFTSKVPKNFVRERKLRNGSTAREWGPFVYGYSVKIGSDGKPKVREFGNVKSTRNGPKVQSEREPLVDIVETDGEVHVVVELPGVDKRDIKLTGSENSLTISVDTPERKYFEDIVFPAKVMVKDARTSYKNGVLEVAFPKFKEETRPKGEPINID